MEQATQTEQSRQAMAAIIAAKTSANYTGFERTVPLETLILGNSITKVKCMFPKRKAAVSLDGVIRNDFPIT